MLTFKVKRGIKVNSETEDGHPDGTEVLIFCEKEVTQEERDKLTAQGAEQIPQDKMYFGIFPADTIPLPIGISDTKVQITSEELEDYILHVEDGVYLEVLEKYWTEILGVISNMEFTLYE